MQLYNVKHIYDDDFFMCVLAESPNKAKMIAQKDCFLDDCVEYIDLRITVSKEKDIKGLEENAIVRDMDGLKRGIYGCLIHEVCPKCGTKDINLYYDNGFYCDNCEYGEDD